MGNYDKDLLDAAERHMNPKGIACVLCRSACHEDDLHYVLDVFDNYPDLAEESCELALDSVDREPFEKVCDSCFATLKREVITFLKLN